MSDFADYLSHHCKMQELSTSELARRLGVSRSYAHQLREGLTAPSDKAIELLAKTLDLPSDDLYVAAGRLPLDLRNRVREVVTLVRQTSASRQKLSTTTRQTKSRRKIPGQSDLFGTDGPQAA
jgi:transcriptional regulator with XRE-family HTH domain